MIDIKLYDRNLTTPVFKENLTERVQNLSFSTKLHGGFHTCSFNLRADLPDAWGWLTGKAFYRLLVSDVEKVLFEGRIEDLTLSAGGAGVTAYGYYANLSDVPYATAYNAVASVVIKAVLTASCAQIASDQTNIAATDITITSAADANYLDIYPNNLIEKLLAFSDSTYGKWDFAIWEDRIPYLTKRSVSSSDWLVKLGDLSRFKLKHKSGELWNSVYAIYDDSGLTRTADATDAASIALYGLTREKVIPHLGTVVAATAQAQRSAWLADHKDIWPKLEDIVLGAYVYDKYGVKFPSYWVRAGEVIRIQDLVPTSADAGTVALDQLRTFFIVETHYNADTGQNRLVLDTESASIEAILARELSPVKRYFV